MLETLFGLVKRSRLSEAQNALAAASEAADACNARTVEVERENARLLAANNEQHRVIVALRRDALTVEQEYKRVCANLVALSDTVGDLTDKLDQLQAQAEKAEACAVATRKQFRSRPASRMTATDFVERFMAGGCTRPERLGLAASRLAKLRGIALTRITAKGADGIERSMNIYPTSLLREASGIHQ